jgi:hypothetical protein
VLLEKRLKFINGPFYCGLVTERRQLLRAIAERNGVEKGALKPHPAAAAVASKDAAERRQVTIVFSDLVGSMALSGRTDPEDLREVISAYHKCVAASDGNDLLFSPSGTPGTTSGAMPPATLPGLFLRIFTQAEGRR